MAEARQANISIYGIDPGGLNGLETYIATRLTMRGASSAAALRAARQKAVLNTDFLRDLADQTGARALVNTDDFAGGIDAVFAVSVERPAVQTRRADTINLLTLALTPDGVERGSDRQTVRLTQRPAQVPAVLETLSQMNLRPGRYQFRVAAHDAGLDIDGSVYADLDIPDVAQLSFALSSVALGFGTSKAAASTARLDHVLPIVPTAQRDFTSRDRVVAFLRVYQSLREPAGDVKLVASIRDVQDAVVFSKASVLGKGLFDRHPDLYAADYRLDVPLTTLQRGECLLTFDAARGTTQVRRSTYFVRR